LLVVINNDPATEAKVEAVKMLYPSFASLTGIRERRIYYKICGLPGQRTIDMLRDSIGK